MTRKVALLRLSLDGDVPDATGHRQAPEPGSGAGGPRFTITFCV